CFALGTLALSSIWHLALWHSALFGTWHFGTQLYLALGTLALSSIWHLALWHSALFGTWHSKWACGIQQHLSPTRQRGPCLRRGLRCCRFTHTDLVRSVYRPGSWRREPTLCRARRIFYNGTRFAPASLSMRILMKIVNYPHPSLRH